MLLLSTSKSPSQRTRTFLNVMEAYFPKVNRQVRGSSTLLDLFNRAVERGASNVGVIQTSKGNPSSIKFWQIESGKVFEANWLWKIIGLSLPIDLKRKDVKSVKIKALDWELSEQMQSSSKDRVKTMLSLLSDKTESSPYHLLCRVNKKDKNPNPHYKIKSPNRDEQEKKQPNSNDTVNNTYTLQIYSRVEQRLLDFWFEVRLIPQRREEVKWE